MGQIDGALDVVAELSGDAIGRAIHVCVGSGALDDRRRERRRRGGTEYGASVRDGREADNGGGGYNGTKEHCCLPVFPSERERP